MFKSLTSFLEALFLILVVGCLLYAGVARLLGCKYRKHFFGTRKINGQGTEIPLEGNLFAVNTILKDQIVFSPENRSRSLSLALFLRWIQEGKVQVKEPDEASKGKPHFYFPENAAFGDPVEKKWYGYFLEAAGEDRDLLARELAYWAGHVEGNSDKVAGEDFVEQGKTWMENHNYIEKVTPWNIHLNETGQKDARRVVELENYLKALMEGKATAEPDSGKVPFYLQLATILGKENEFLAVLKEKYPAQHAALAACMGCSDKQLNPIVAYCRRMVETMWNDADEHFEDYYAE